MGTFVWKLESVLRFYSSIGLFLVQEALQLVVLVARRKYKTEHPTYI